MQLVKKLVTLKLKADLKKQIQKDRRLKSILSKVDSRKVRDAQSSINKDIKSTKRELAKGENEYLRSYLHRLEDLQFMMRRSNVIDGIRTYNYASVRLKAYEEYITYYKGAGRRSEYRTKPVSYASLESNNIYKSFGDIDSMDVPGIDELREEYYRYVSTYQYERAKDVLNEMRRLEHNYTIFMDQLSTSTDYDEY